ncbi:ATPase SWSAP1-like [Antedon mediterranea]|uniref:ATPase SWSAP1-like n=1 Tax=Antedon mediterranea TaxID=105859 RepID=UPI003AF6F039
MADFLKCVFPKSPKIDRFIEIPHSINQKDNISISNVITCDRCLLVGSPGSGKTSLLFQCALSCSMEGSNVTLITPYKLKTMPLLIEGAKQPDHNVMKRVHIMYLQDRTSLLRYLSSLHTKSPLSHVILINKLDYYTNQEQVTDRTAVTSEICAYLLDAICFLQSKLNALSMPTSTSIKCLLAASVSTLGSTDSPILDIYQQFIPTVFHISGFSNEKHVFELTTAKGDEKRCLVLRYMIGKDSIKVCEDVSLSTLNTT